MKHRSLPVAVSLLVLCGCTPAPSGPLSLPLQERLRNPLVAERYWSELTEHMADLVRTKDPIIKDAVKSAIIDSEKNRAIDRVAQARKLKNEGINGTFQTPTIHEDAEGEVLLRENTLYFGTTFTINPNPSVGVFLTTLVDPRDGSGSVFPDKTSVDLGELQTAYGPQEYVIPAERMNPQFRTVVLYDTRLERIIGFAQLSK